uniref:DYW domain-containing protein n=1 Tax=Cajanus cajan TaxID=3821 RepID=A0A151UAV6_CAJCA|nr:hypothetical protein KK1_020700 [Cajanus cajan]
MWVLQIPQIVRHAPSQTHICHSSHFSSRLPVCFVSLNPSANPFKESNRNHLIQSLCKGGNLSQAIHLLCCEPNPTQQTFEHLIYSCAQQNSLSDALFIHRRLVDDGFDQDPFLATKLINMYYELGCIDRAREVFDETRERTIYVWNALFRALAMVGRDVYAKFGSVLCANSVFCAMPTKNFVSWSAMIACFAKNEMPMKALELFQLMMLEACDSVPNSVTMVSVLQACAGLAALGHGKLIHGYILRRGLDSILPVLSSLITMYGRCGEILMGQRVFDNMKNRDVISWNSLISIYGMHGFGKKAIQIFENMIHQGVSPSYISFITVLGACSHAGLVEEGKILFESMLSKYRIHPGMEHYACMVDLLGRANRLDEAIKLIEDMRFEPGPTVWGSLLGSCRIHCNVELAERASTMLFELEPRNAGNYVLLADIYAEAKMWSEAKNVMKLLESRGLQKLPGCSWIEVKKKVYSFVSVDEHNPQIDEIHALLVKLSTEMKEQGYVPHTNVVLYELDEEEKEKIVLGHSEKLAVAFGLINTAKGETIRIRKNLRLCEDCHAVTKFISKFANREILVRDVNRFHHFKDGICSCGDYW